MPVLDAGFHTQDGRPDGRLLVTYGPTVQVTVGHYAPDAGQPRPSKVVFALVDTGSYQSCIDAALALELGLPVVDTALIAGAGGESTHDVFLAHIQIPQLEIVQYGRFTGVNLRAGRQAHEVLLGRTFLANAIVIYDGLRSQVTIATARLP
jgi:hypothetical protein